jgi:hypothetical protein
LYQWVRGIFWPKIGKYGWTTTRLLRIPALDRGLGDGEIEMMFTSKATMFFRINRYENDCVPIADSSRPDGCRHGKGSGTADRGWSSDATTGSAVSATDDPSVSATRTRDCGLVGRGAARRGNRRSPAPRVPADVIHPQDSVERRGGPKEQRQRFEQPPRNWKEARHGW